ncbi:MAG: Isoquinoline 1-oxidoreductase subunit [Bdellovibrionaceae bacterium]|nr:Isoquinoline 1-oxidoreductase subunit [Pseudobdellovibrionaceae bacterium]
MNSFIPKMIFCCGIFLSGTVLAAPLKAEAKALGQKESSLQFFNQAAAVFQHPRCINCHPSGEQPHQGMDQHVHIMNVQRGVGDNGAVGMKCATCHGNENNKYSGVPGAPHWQLAPKEMAWEGLSKGDLCRKLKDPKNPGMFAGGKTKEEFIKHNAEDKLVGWGWNPGTEREPAPMNQKKFGQIIAKWINTGAECPE